MRNGRLHGERWPGGSTHEIKNPLTPIQLSAQRLQKRYAGRFGQDGKVFEECTNTIIRQVEEMKNLVNEFSQFARMPAVNPVFSDLNHIVSEVIAFYQQAHRSVPFTFEEDPSLPRLLLDADQIRRVLINLLDNAMDATEQHAPIVLVTRYDPFLRIAVLEVVDEGSGISKDMRERIFEPYTSTKKGGTGLGLAIVKTIVADHNGYIRVRDNKPQGTRFVLEFPRLPKKSHLRRSASSLVIQRTGSTPHSSGFCLPCIWNFLNSLQATFSTGC